MTSYNVQSMFNSMSIQFETDNKDHYERVQKVIRECIDEEDKSLKPLPCPFCGAAAVVGKVPSQAGPYYFVSCENDDCDVNPGTCYCDTREEAVEIWNRRAGK